MLKYHETSSMLIYFFYFISIYFYDESSLYVIQAVIHCYVAMLHLIHWIWWANILDDDYYMGVFEHGIYPDSEFLEIGSTRLFLNCWKTGGVPIIFRHTQVGLCFGHDYMCRQKMGLYAHTSGHPMEKLFICPVQGVFTKCCWDECPKQFPSLMA